MIRCAGVALAALLVSVLAAGTARAAEGDALRTSVGDAIRALDKAVTKGVIHRNTAARKKSALARRLVAAR